MAHDLLGEERSRFVQRMEVLMKRVLVASLVALAGTYGLTASAQEQGMPQYLEKKMAAPASAFEIGAAGLYNQGWGHLTDSSGNAPVNLQDNAGSGIAGELDLGYRLNPNLTLGLYGMITEFNGARNVENQQVNQRSVAAGVQGQFFLRPYHVVNPWVGLGTAWRGYWSVPDVGGITSRQGWQIARLEIGVDMRASRAISIGPYVGGSLDVWFTEKQPGQDSRNLDGPPLSAFFIAGIMGRFDIGGVYIPSLTPAVASR